jgi:hypothetical protein
MFVLFCWYLPEITSKFDLILSLVLFGLAAVVVQRFDHADGLERQRFGDQPAAAVVKATE